MVKTIKKNKTKDNKSKIKNKSKNKHIKSRVKRKTNLINTKKPYLIFKVVMEKKHINQLPVK